MDFCSGLLDVDEWSLLREPEAACGFTGTEGSGQCLSHLLATSDGVE